MRPLILLPSLLALAVAQIETFSFGPIPSVQPSSVINVEPTPTDTEPGPINTARACGRVANLVARSRSQFPIVDADVSFLSPQQLGRSSEQRLILSVAGICLSQVCSYRHRRRSPNYYFVEEDVGVPVNYGLS